MKLGLIVVSLTGTTLEFGRIIADRLREAGHDVEMTELKTDVPIPTSPTGKQGYEFINIPDCDKYDGVLFGGPVWAFTASHPIIKAMASLKGLSGKKFMPFVTMGFPLPSMGGKRAAAVMGKMADKAGAQVLPGKIACKMFRDIKAEMDKAASEIPAYFK